MIEQTFPPGWDEQRVRRLLAELNSRTEDEWVAADEAATAEQDDQVVVSVPVGSLPEIRRLLAAYKPNRPDEA
jgi:prephenate dehydrogenase